MREKSLRERERVRGERISVSEGEAGSLLFCRSNAAGSSRSSNSKVSCEQKERFGSKTIIVSRINGERQVYRIQAQDSQKDGSFSWTKLRFLGYKVFSNQPQ
ncbi:unnamed protein product [Linum trigynum]|uniref:Uncharacterized protein n=1 Tax=Linum trigynum TaxID=586398 RepID=A0AAV2DX18_9ROSI